MVTRLIKWLFCKSAILEIRINIINSPKLKISIIYSFLPKPFGRMKTIPERLSCVNSILMANFNDYKSYVKSSGDFLTLKQGENKIRVVSEFEPFESEFQGKMKTRFMGYVIDR